MDRAAAKVARAAERLAVGAEAREAALGRLTAATEARVAARASVAEGLEESR